MNNNNATKKLKGGRFNFIDVIIILVVIAVVSIFVYLLANNKIFSTAEQTEILYTIEISRIANEVVPDIKKLEKGQNIIDSVRGYDIGKIEKVEISPAMANVTDITTGVIYEREFPEFSKVVITVRAKGETDKGYILDGYKVLVGVQVHFRTPHLVSVGYCTSITEVESSETDKTETTSASTK